MRKSNVPLMLKACELSVIEGESNGRIAKKLGIDPSTVSRWTKQQIWQDFEKELIDAQKKAILSKQSLVGVENAP